jgi:phosphatidylinositol dimannoside acyltransferase
MTETSSSGTSIAEQATYLAYAGGWQAVRRMPEGMAYGMFDRLADNQWKRQGASVKRLEANLRRVVGPVSNDELRRFSREGMRSYMRYWCDAFRLPGWDRERIDTFEITNSGALSEALSRGGVVVALPHAGNWDHAGAYASVHFSPIHTVAEKLRPEQLFDRFVAFRTGLGMTIHGLGNAGVFTALAETLRQGGLVALLADRDLAARGIDVTFFGERARFPAGPAALAIDTGATLLAADLFWGGHNMATLVRVPLDESGADRQERIRRTTQTLADLLSVGIARHPVDWHMLQRLWLADLDPERLAAQDAAARAADAGSVKEGG